MPTNPLAAKSNSALAMAFGMCIQSSPSTTPVGALSSLAEELGSRGLLLDLMAELGGEHARSLTLRITVDRQRARRARRTA